MSKGPQSRYQHLIKVGALEDDDAQRQAVMHLQALHAEVSTYCQSRSSWWRKSRPAPRGIYLWGGVGLGKTLLMDLFYNNTSIGKKRRIHFHEFMADVHERIAAWRTADEKTRRRHKGLNKSAPDDPLAPVAADLASEALLLCFDEFQVADIADAMILGRLFTALFEQGVVIVATSNRHPDDLYKDGLNRQLFLPFIATLKERVEIHHLQSQKDYRLEKLEGAPIYYSPLGDEADTAMDAAWQKVISGASAKQNRIKVKGRTLIIPLAARGAARFDFSDLCEKPLGASDYMAIVQHYGTIFMDRIPMMSADARNEAKRFVTLIDTLYDTRTKFVCSAASEPDELYQHGDGAFEFERTASRLYEMRSKGYLAAEQDFSALEEDANSPD